MDDGLDPVPQPELGQDVGHVSFSGRFADDQVAADFRVGQAADEQVEHLAFFRDLTDRGLAGVALVTSDAHRGLTDAIGATLPGAAWQRCRTHYAANMSVPTAIVVA